MMPMCRGENLSEEQQAAVVAVFVQLIREMKPGEVRVGCASNWFVTEAGMPQRMFPSVRDFVEDGGSSAPMRRTQPDDAYQELGRCIHKATGRTVLYGKYTSPFMSRSGVHLEFAGSLLTGGSDVDKNKPIMKMDDLEQERAFDEICCINDAAMMDESVEESSGTMDVAVAVLTRPDGSRSIPFHTEEYGDGEGTRQVGQTVRRLRRTGKLKQGEKIDREVWSFRCQDAVKKRKPVR